MVDALARQLDPFQHLVGHMGQAVAGRVDQQQLLLDAHGEGLTLTEAMRTLAHGVTPSAERAATRPSTSAAARPLA